MYFYYFQWFSWFALHQAALRAHEALQDLVNQVTRPKRNARMEIQLLRAFVGLGKQLKAEVDKVLDVAQRLELRDYRARTRLAVVAVQEFFDAQERGMQALAGGMPSAEALEEYLENLYRLVARLKGLVQVETN